MFVIAFVLLMLLSACSAPAPSGRDAARALIDESAAAMGGWAAMDAVKVQQIITAGGDFEPMQAVKPNGEPRVINRFSQGRMMSRVKDADVIVTNRTHDAVALVQL